MSIDQHEVCSSASLTLIPNEFYAQCKMCHKSNRMFEDRYKQIGNYVPAFFICNSKGNTICDRCVARYHIRDLIKGVCCICSIIFLKEQKEDPGLTVDPKGNTDFFMWQDGRVCCFDCLRQHSARKPATTERIISEFKDLTTPFSNKDIKTIRDALTRGCMSSVERKHGIDCGTEEIVKRFQIVTDHEARDIASKLTNEELSQLLGFKSPDHKDFILACLRKSN